MEISAFSIKVILILIPGVISTLIYENLALRPRDVTPFRFILFSIVFGVMSYLILSFIWMIFSESDLEVFSSMSSTNSIPAFEIIYASMIAVILGLAITALGNMTIRKLSPTLLIGS